MSPAIAIVDYGAGNLQSVRNSLAYVGAKPEIIKDPEKLAQFGGFVLPGVGAFEPAIKALNEIGMAQALAERKQAGCQVLGICLGMQLMCTSSEENGFHRGLNWISATVTPIEPEQEIKVPHVGWNSLNFKKNHQLLGGVSDGSDVYFVHGYKVKCERESDVVATTNYGGEFASIFSNENIFGVQFHPEKSQRIGLKIIENFTNTVKQC